jgi:polyribonucleotide nucleotidyltransferase
MKKTIEKELEIAGRTLTLEFNKVAPQASGSVIARYGDTEVLVTVMLGPEKAYSDGGAPVTVDFVERLYAGGIIKGSRWVKREGRPTDDAILTNRLIDRSIRPLFPKDMANEVQIVVTLLSTDNANDHDILALNAVSAALATSNIPWAGPIGAVRVGYIAKDDAGYVVNPQISEMEFSDLDLVVAGNSDGVVMIEAGAKQLPEDKAAKAIELALTESQKIADFLQSVAKDIGKDKFPYTPQTQNAELLAEIDKKHHKEIEELVHISGPEDRMDGSRVEEYKKSLVEEYAENPNKNQIPQMAESLFKKALRQKTLATKKRADGRSFTEIRPIAAEVGLLPRTHGSGLFQRGLTQVLSVVTLASPSLEQWIETAEGMEEKRYIHHYNAPPYSSGETGRMGGLGRREIGHGALAERALSAVIPTTEKFPYTIRVVSEVLSQNGSSSMGSTCGSTLALMDAGVPIAAPVSGIAMGLIAESPESYAVLSDLRGEEDFYGNMDFKVAGTEGGITAIQLDIKLNEKFRGLTTKMITEILAQAHDGRLEILQKMLAVIPETRKTVSQYAPKVITIKVPVEKIGEVIGPGGKNIRNIIATTGASVDIDDDGTVTISSVDAEAVEKARSWIDGMTRELTAGEEFEGEVKRILPFGAFVEVLPGKEGLVHVSRMTAGYVGNPEEVVQIGQKVKVKVMEIDDMGRLNLAMYWGPKDQTQAAPGAPFGGIRPSRPPFRPSGGGRGGFNRGGGGRRGF